ncbi:MAG: LAGLIDADG family homing endonuclease [archaeon]
MQTIFIFDIENSKESEGIFIHSIHNETKKAVELLGGVKRVSKLLNEKYNKVKEWRTDRKPISIIDAKKLFRAVAPVEQTRLMKSIQNNAHIISCNYSATKVKFPKQISTNLAYCVGIILGDGHLSKIYSDRKTTWHLSVYFDNKEHQDIYDDIIKKEFGITSKHYQRKPNCFESCINSKAIHWFFSKYFEINSGKKCDRIFLTKKILNNEEIIRSAISGLFDSDGTITKNGTIQYATTSKIMALQVLYELNKIGINSSSNIWIKDKKYLPLYSIRIFRKSNNTFAQKVGFRHPLKKVLLEKFTNSPFV